MQAQGPDTLGDKPISWWCQDLGIALGSPLNGRGPIYLFRAWHTVDVQ